MVQEIEDMHSQDARSADEKDENGGENDGEYEPEDEEEEPSEG